MFLITGANTGLGKVIVTAAFCFLLLFICLVVGFESAKVLASKGATVVMAYRNEEKSKAAVEVVTKIASENEGKVETLVMDLGDLSSVKKAAEEFIAKDLPLHCLMNNAGIMMCPKGFTTDGLETQLGVNHFGHFALTAQLFPVLQKTAQSMSAEDPVRIVNLTSSYHAQGPKEGILFDNLKWEAEKSPKYTPELAYGHSKFANVVFTKELQDQLNKKGEDKIAIFAVHPGFVDTELTRHKEKQAGKIIVQMYKKAKGALHVRDGALTQLYCALSPEVIENNWKGDYFVPIAQHSPLNAKAPAITKPMQEKLWTVSEELTGVKFQV